MRAEQFVGLILCGLFLVVGLSLMIWYETRPQTKVTGKVARLWQDSAPGSDEWGFPRSFIELERDGQRATYSCAPGYYDELEIGQTVRLHLKGKNAEYLRVLNSAEDGSQRPQ